MRKDKEKTIELVNELSKEDAKKAWEEINKFIKEEKKIVIIMV
jgi:ABC-type transporter Mla MlaB component